MTKYDAAMARAAACFVDPGETPATLKQVETAIEELSAAWSAVTGAEAQRATDLLDSLMNLREIVRSPVLEPVGSRFAWRPGQLTDMKQPAERAIPEEND